MNLLILSDGKPGHFKKSAALADAIGRAAPCDVGWLEVRLRWAGLHELLRLQMKRRRTLPPASRLAWFYKFDGDLPARPDLIISSGGKTVFMNAWLSQHYGCANVFIGDTRGIDDGWFSRRLVHDDAHAGDPRFVATLIPTDIDDQSLAAACASYVATRDPGFARRHHWTLLIGGNSGGYRFSERDWQLLADALPLLAKRFGIRWLITTSRRTPRAAERWLLRPEVRACCDELQIFRTDPRRIYNALLACGDVVFCTEDSGSMLSEATATGKRVISLRPQRCVQTEALRNLLDWYVSRGQVTRAAIATLHQLREMPAAAPMTDAAAELRAVARSVLGTIRRAA